MANRLKATAERSIEAPTGKIYQFIADFESYDPKFLPSAISNPVVEQGGFGAGTIHRVTMTIGGQSQTYRLHVEEPEPGRILTESEIGGSALTTFTVDPEGSGCRVRIETSWEAAKGLSGFIDRLLGPWLLRRVLEERLKLLGDRARSHTN